MMRRGFLLGALSAAWLGCRPEEAIGPTVAPADLAGRIEQIKQGKVVVLYVGPDSLFKSGRVPGARNIGEAGSRSGREAIGAALASLPQDAEVVLYCGCCPVRSCPNVRPASAAIREAHRGNVRVLDLPTRFATDWADKGYPVERG